MCQIMCFVLTTQGHSVLDFEIFVDKVVLFDSLNEYEVLPEKSGVGKAGIRRFVKIVEKGIRMYLYRYFTSLFYW